VARLRRLSPYAVLTFHQPTNQPIKGSEKPRDWAPPVTPYTGGGTVEEGIITHHWSRDAVDDQVVDHRTVTFRPPTE
jgi:hypothetical protein